MFKDQLYNVIDNVLFTCDEKTRTYLREILYHSQGEYGDSSSDEYERLKDVIYGLKNGLDKLYIATSQFGNSESEPAPEPSVESAPEPSVESAPEPAPETGAFVNYVVRFLDYLMFCLCIGAGFYGVINFV
jgi:hypothetical protein